MSLASYPETFLEAAETIIGRLRDESTVSAATAIHATWHLAGYALHFLANDPAALKNDPIPWSFAEPNTMPVPAGWRPPMRARGDMADSLHAELFAVKGPAAAINWLSVLKILAEILMFFLAGGNKPAAPEA